MLITIFANSGVENPYAIHVVSAVKLFYKQKLSFWVALIVVITMQILGFGWAGIFRPYLVEGPKSCPDVPIQVSTPLRFSLPMAGLFMIKKREPRMD